MPPKDTLNINYIAFKESLPKNLRLTPEKDYHMYDYWRLSGEPENFKEGKRRGMFTWDWSDWGYHAGSIAEDRNTGIYHFMKPKHHPTVKYELDWFNNGLKTLEGGKQVPVEGKDKEFWEDFTSKYQLDTTGVDYRYVPIQKKGGNIHIKKKNRGKFTESAKRAGMGVQEFARHVLANKDKYSPTLVKRANFARNSKKFKHQDGGVVKYQTPAKTLDLPEGSIYGGELEPAVVKPAPLYGVLNTYYPVISKFPFTGHSELQIVDFGWDKALTISKYGTDYDYNLVTNNCSDATRCAVEKIFGEKINPILFTTPGDVQDFVAEKTGQKPVKKDVGQTSLGFNVPFATAMDLKNQTLDFYIQDYLHKAAKMKKQMKEENPNWNSASFDLSTAEVIQRYKDQKYKFQPFKNKNGGILKAQGGSGQSFWPTLETSLQKTGLVPKETHINVPMYTHWDGHTSIEVPLEEAERAFGFYRNVMPSETIPSAEELQNIANKEIIFSDIKDNWKDHVNDDDVKSLFGIISNDTQKFIGSLPIHKNSYVKGDTDISDTINITAPNTNISKFIFGNKISKDAIKEINRVAKLRSQDPYDILAHMLIEGSGSEPLRTDTYYNTHDVVQRQINPSLYNNYTDSDTILKQLGIYNGKNIPNINVIKKAYEKVKTKRNEAVKNLKVPESSIDAVALRMLLHGRDFNPAQKGLKGVWTEGEVKNTYLDMIDSAIKSLKENMPDLFN